MIPAKTPRGTVAVSLAHHRACYPPDRSEVTLYCVVVDADAAIVVLGKATADNEAENMAYWPQVRRVTVAALVWDSGPEREAIDDGYLGDLDLATPVAALATRHGLLFDPADVRPIGLLADLRVLALAHERDVAGAHAA